MWNVFYRFETIKESFLWSCCCIQVTCVWGAFDIWVIGLNPTTSKTRPTFESLRELRLIYNREMFLRWDGLESTPRKASQAEEVALLYFLCTWRVCVCACGQGGVTSGTGVSMGGHRHEKEPKLLSDLGHVQGGGHFLQLCLHCAVAEGSLQNRLLDSQELTHLFQICKRTTETCCSKEQTNQTMVVVCDVWTQSWGPFKRKMTGKTNPLFPLKYLCPNMENINLPGEENSDFMQIIKDKQISDCKKKDKKKGEGGIERSGDIRKWARGMWVLCYETLKRLPAWETHRFCPWCGSRPSRCSVTQAWNRCCRASAQPPPAPAQTAFHPPWSPRFAWHSGKEKHTKYMEVTKSEMLTLVCKSKMKLKNYIFLYISAKKKLEWISQKGLIGLNLSVFFEHL